MNPVIKHLMEGGLRARQFALNDLPCNDPFDSDREIMHAYPHLDCWVRDYTTRELEKEREEMLIQNLALDGMVKTVDEFDAMHKGSTGRLVIVVDRAYGFRIKYPIFAKRTSEKYLTFEVDEQTARVLIYHIEILMDACAKAVEAGITPSHGERNSVKSWRKP
jgi:hypothetical protein